jgi:hypothetical protein
MIVFQCSPALGRYAEREATGFAMRKGVAILVQVVFGAVLVDSPPLSPAKPDFTHRMAT